LCIAALTWHLPWSGGGAVLSRTGGHPVRAREAQKPGEQFDFFCRSITGTVTMRVTRQRRDAFVVRDHYRTYCPGLVSAINIWV